MTKLLNSLNFLLGILPIILSFLTFSLFRFSLGIATPKIIVELSLTPFQTGLIFSSNLITMALGMFLVNKVSEKLSNFRLFLLSSGLILTSLILLGLAWDYFILIFSVTLMGIGSGLLNPLVFFVLGKLNPSRKGLMLGLGNTIYSIGGVLGPILTALSIASLGWRFIFLVYGFIAVIAVIFNLLKRASMILSTNSMNAHASYFNLLKKKEVLNSCLCMFLSNFAFVIVISWVPIFLSTKMMIEAQTVGIAFMLFSLLGALGSIITGAMSDKFGDRNLLILTSLLSALLSFIYSLESYPVELVLIQASLLGFFVIPFWMLLTSIAQRIVDEESKLAVTGLIQTFALLGGIISPLSLSLLIDTFSMGILISMLTMPFFILTTFIVVLGIKQIK
ncbi:MAG: MFS transporter [Nitrososphaerales archaeon]